MGKFSRLGNDLYNGKKSIDFVGRRWLWYTGSLLIILVCVGGLYFKGLNWGIEFTGGAEYKVTAAGQPGHPGPWPTTCARPSRTPASTTPPSPVVTTTGNEGILVQTEPLTTAESAAGHGRHPRDHGRRPPATSRSPRSAPAGARRSRSARCSAWPSSWCSWSSSSGRTSDSGRCPRPPSWRWPTTCVITIGVYAISGFEVTPATVTGILTILGFSLYDTVVVFDKVRENTKDLRGHPHDVRRGGQPGGQPDPGPLDQHLDRGADPGRLHPVRRRRPARLGLDEGPRAGAVRRHGRRCLLLGLHRHPAAGAPQERRVRGGRGREAGEGPASRPGRPLRLGPGLQADDMPIQAEPGADPPTGRAPRRSRWPPGRRARPRPSGRGRVVPPARSEVKPSGASGRQQPTRQPRSKRGKK